MTKTCRCVKSIKTCEITSLIEHTMELNIHFFVDQSLREAQTKSKFLLNFTNGALKLQNISPKKVRLLSSFHFFSSFFSFPFFLSSFLLLFTFDGGKSGGMITLGIPPGQNLGGDPPGIYASAKGTHPRNAHPTSLWKIDITNVLIGQFFVRISCENY